jgi:hypothetical protein
LSPLLSPPIKNSQEERTVCMVTLI